MTCGAGHGVSGSETGTAMPIASDADVIVCSRRAQCMAEGFGFEGGTAADIATAVAEIARNIVVHAKRGDISIAPVSVADRTGIEIRAEDSGPGISDIATAMKDGFTTGRSLGIGLAGARRLMDEFEIASPPGGGTTVTMRKWLP